MIGRFAHHLGRSESGQSLPKCDVRDMSGFPSIATDERTSRDVSNVPTAEVAVAAYSIKSLAR